jgi:hypothetical protein
VLLQTILIYMVAGLIFPDFFGDAVVDLKESFYAHRRWFFSLALAMVIASVCKTIVLDHNLPDPADLTFHAIFGRRTKTAKSVALPVAYLFLVR